jgi:hypothetical protein
MDIKIPMVELTLKDGRVLKECHIYREDSQFGMIVMDNPILVTMTLHAGSTIYYQSPTLQGKISGTDIKEYTMKMEL